MVLSQNFFVYTFSDNLMVMEKKKKLGRPPKDKTSDAVLPPIRVSKEQLNAYKAAATGADKSFSAWVRDCLDEGVK